MFLIRYQNFLIQYPTTHMQLQCEYCAPLNSNSCVFHWTSVLLDFIPKTWLSHCYVSLNMCYHFRDLVDEDNGGYSLISFNCADDQFMLGHLPRIRTTQLCSIILNFFILFIDLIYLTYIPTIVSTLVRWTIILVLECRRCHNDL